MKKIYFLFFIIASSLSAQPILFSPGDGSIWMKSGSGLSLTKADVGSGSYEYTMTNVDPDQSVTNELQTLAFNSTTGVLSISGGNSVTLPLYLAPTTGIVMRTLNSNFTISTTKQAFVTYTVTCSVTNPLLVGTSAASAYLEYSVNAGSTWVSPSQSGNSSGVGVTVTLQLTNGQTGTMAGYIPANALVRVRTSTAGTGTVTWVTGQETY